jgi:flagellar motility protein MotE (MotC chaperone)
MNRLRRYFRLLPVVVAVGLGVLAIKGVDLARAAQAPAANSDAPDNTGLAPSDSGGSHTGPDFAADGGTSASAAEVDVLTSLTRRRAELDARERALNMHENILNAGEGRVDQKINALKALQTQIQGLLAQRDAAQDKQIASLVKTYSAMKPKDAARIFDTLADEVLIPVAKDMKSDVLAPVLAAMNSEAAQRLTVKLAALLKLPEAPASADCQSTAGMTPATMTTPAAPAPGNTTASATPPMAAPLQTAALTPPPAIVPPVQTTPAPATAPVATAPAPAKPVAAARPPKPRKPLARKLVPAKPATASVTPPAPTATATSPAPNTSLPAKPVTAAATPAVTPPNKPVTAAAATAPAKPVAPTPATAPVTKPVTTPPAPASGLPAALTPANATGG